jgi:hypothetical protein
MDGNYNRKESAWFAATAILRFVKNYDNLVSLPTGIESILQFSTEISDLANDR